MTSPFVKKATSPEIPNLYIGPLGLPLAWRDERSGILPAAVAAYFEEATGRGKATPEQLVLVRNYVRYYVEAPCWVYATNDPDQIAEIDALRTLAREAPPTKEGIWSVIEAGLDLGIDPL